jgi:hypothetical protein
MPVFSISSKRGWSEAAFLQEGQKIDPIMQATIKNPGSILILAKITKVIIFIMTFVVNILRKVLSIN